MLESVYGRTDGRRLVWSYLVEETGVVIGNHRPWTGNHYPATCLYPGSNQGRSGDKRVFYHCVIQATTTWCFHSYKKNMYSEKYGPFVYDIISVFVL